MEQQTANFRFSLNRLLIFVIFIAIVCAIPSWVGRMAISQNTLDRLCEREPSLTREQVLEIAGPPHYRRGDKEFRYNVWNGFVFFSDMFCIQFDTDGNVTWMSF